MDKAADYAAIFESQLPEEWAGKKGVEYFRKVARRERLERIQASLSLGRSFVGSIILDREDGLASDQLRLMDIARELANGLAITYWTDGAYCSKGSNKGVMGAGVVGVSGPFRYALRQNGGRYTGSSNDAELLAISLALKHAKSQVQEGAEFRLVRIYTDSQRILNSLNDSTPSAQQLGPMIPGEMLALEVLFDHTEWLHRLGISTELVWVKSHHASNGNEAADALATLAISEHVDLQTQLYGGKIPKREAMNTADAPAAFKRLGDDWVEEWLYRANRGLDLISRLDINQMLAYLKLSIMMKPPAPKYEKPTPKKPQRPWDTPDPLHGAFDQAIREPGHGVTLIKALELERRKVGGSRRPRWR